MSQTTDKTICRIVADILFKQGVRHVVCSPGSRNAPLLLAFNELEEMELTVAVDERSAAYLALGISMVSRECVALVCTSGTALLNYAPAVAEAYYQGLPLIVVSADRPEEWIDQDDSQTLRQFEALANFVKNSYDIVADDESESNLWYINRIVNDAMITATCRRNGPVHINVRLDNPLGGTSDSLLPKQRIITRIDPPSLLSTEQILNLAESLYNKKILIVAGFNRPDHLLNKGMSAMASLRNVHLMCETISNIRTSGDCSALDNTLCSLDDKSALELSPDVVISIGGALVSRYVKEYIRKIAKIKTISHYNVGYFHTTVDCFKSLTCRIETLPGPMFRRLAGSIAKLQANEGIEEDVAGYAERWRSLTLRCKVSHKEFISNAEWSSLVAFDELLHKLPSDCNLFLSNGTPIRYAQLIFDYKVHASFCNRGVSGIEGQLATACGGAMIYDRLNVCIIGDTSFAHDVGSLAYVANTANILVIVINNNGGEIFRFIESTSSLQCREKLFCAPQGLNVELLSKAYGIKYYSANSKDSLVRILPQLYRRRNSAAILEVFVPENSAEVLKNYMNRKV